MKRKDVFKRDKYFCVYCRTAGTDDDLSVDHVEPRMRQGDNSPGNLVTACKTCNTLKSGLAAWQFLESRPDLRANFLANTPYVWPRLKRAIVEAAEKYEQRRR